MKILIQRVSKAHVEVEDKIVGTITNGVLVFIGVTHNDSDKQAKWLANKLINLRMFVDENGKINKSLLNCHGEILVISQFTLYADCSTGRRPSFTEAAHPGLADSLYKIFVEELRKFGLKVETGIFGAKMSVSLVNDGPVTLLIESP
jgi:D-tyrosyl-tRNA(Tyr) deacylase